MIRREAVALALAGKAGISITPWKLHLIDGKAVLIVVRFDRRDTQRVGYMSAMTTLEATDGEEASYLDIADVIERGFPSVGKDLRQLWRRIAFSILISNTDDHLRKPRLPTNEFRRMVAVPRLRHQSQPGARPQAPEHRDQLRHHRGPRRRPDGCRRVLPPLRG